MEEANKKERATLRRSTLVASLGRADKFLAEFIEERDKLEVAVRLEDLDNLRQQFETVQTTLEELERTEAGMARNLISRSSFEKLFFKIKAGLLSKIPSTNLPNAHLPLHNFPQNGSGLRGLKLPTISLPEFSGDYKDWRGFYDTFFALIHNNPDVPDIQKFHYLKAAVKGEASQLIESIDISAADYQSTWEALVDRYSNDYVMKKKRLQELFDVPKMKVETADSLHRIVDIFERHVKALNQMGEPTEQWSTILEHMLCNRLHDETLKAWEDFASNLTQPTYSGLIEFLHRRNRVLESITVNHSPPSQRSAVCNQISAPMRYNSGVYAGTNSLKCHACDQSHPLMKCPTFVRMSLEEKLNVVNSKRLCFNCFRRTHQVRNCPNHESCRICHGRHHSMLHPGYVSETGESRPARNVHSVNITNGEEEIASETSSCLHVNVAGKCIFMPTAIVTIVDCYGREHMARAVLDCASQVNLISSKLAQTLCLQRKYVNLIVKGVGDQPKRAKHSVATQIRSLKEDFQIDVDFVILEKLTPKLPSHDISVDRWNVPCHIQLADPQFFKSKEIDVLISNEHFFSLFKTTDRIVLGPSLPMLVDSVFGWLVCGAANLETESNLKTACHVEVMSLISLEQALEKFWMLEEPIVRSNLTAQEKTCETHYTNHVSRKADGRYVVRMPRHDDFDNMIGESRTNAMKRFFATERRLEADENLKTAYHEFMREYIGLGHMQQVNPNSPQSNNVFYLPHHPVFKEDSTTTKTRVVFDGSAKSSSGYSLNDALLVGPVIQDDLISLILRFRTYPFVIVADIEKMYRQVLIHPDETSLQRIFWRFDKNAPLQEFELSTVTYGLSPSSFLATRTLLQLANEDGHRYPLGKAALTKGFYIDDCIYGAETIAETLQTRDELIHLLEKGKFTLRKFASNNFKILEGLSPDKLGTRPTHQFDTSVKTLGIVWKPEKDILCFDSRLKPTAGTVTKRAILSSISQLFDPLGLVAPIVVRGKMIMQQIFLLSCGWDDEVSESIKEKWQQYVDELPKLQQFHLNRLVLLPGSEIQLHTFTDASEMAYGCCIYVRSTDSKGNVSVHLIAAKSRLAPLRRVTLPRLELCAAETGAHLFTAVKRALAIQISESFFWSDSMVTLQWLRAPPNTWKTFVANRVSEIQTETQGSRWDHVPGKTNPADLVSRGQNIDKFIESSLWKYGPHWLTLSRDKWPISSIPEYPENGTERRKQFVVATVNCSTSYTPIFTNFKSLNRLTRVVTYCFRFFRNTKNKTRTQPDPHASQDQQLLPDELAATRLRLLHLAQSDGFRDEIKELQSGRTLSKHSKIRKLSPFVDEDGVLRVGGRLRLSDLPYHFKHPALLPNFHPYTIMIAKFYHLKLVHGGIRVTLAAMREKYWPINGRRTIRNVMRNCFRCARASPAPENQQTGQLPAHRVTPQRPFAVTGVDFAGPVYLKPAHKRAAATKAYICIFVCFVTKAVHIELVSNLASSGFLATFRRFVGRRGPPAHVYSDNGRNFLGVKNELEAIQKLNATDTESFFDYCATEGISWHLNPPKAAHFGGLWEAAVKVCKKQMYRQLGDSKLSFEDLTTVLVQIEASMNSRPLVQMSEDPNDFACLTPGHFLIGDLMGSVPEFDIRDVPINLLDHNQHLQRMYQNFWHNWRTEYLQEMQRETKTCDPNTNLQPGRLVAIVDEFQIPVKWPLGRIVSVHPGEDGLIRVVTLKTAKGFVKRPVTKVCLLPQETPEEASALNANVAPGKENPANGEIPPSNEEIQPSNEENPADNDAAAKDVQ
ncbi:uncharacterized protein LOC129742126 [Uranotaenia lowii]|uniref:uncharacterized protein LOC129742126 n=1 Tax=Uranotaenia lowii TaxID=190385 RepID=UPI00247AC98C|nr:uncharacterized protein LOC129742126 [Uranotaenia lowii]